MFKRYDNQSKEALSNPLKFEYVNWKGEIGTRTIIPLEVWYGYTDYHTEQWMLKAWDIDKDDERNFAINDIVKFL